MERLHARWTVVPVVVCCLAGLFLACGSTGGSIEVEQLKEAPDPPSAGNEYTINVGDMLSIQVWDQDRMSARVRVRSDGRISYPFVNEIEAAGKTPVKLAGDLETGLKSVILNPMVTVVVEESKPPTLSISVLGEVSKPGVHPLEPGAGVAQALAAAGGLTTFAHKNRIFVLRSGSQPGSESGSQPGSQATRIHFTYDGLTRKAGSAPLFKLRSGDVIVVE